MGNKKKTMPRRPHRKVAPNKAGTPKKTGGKPEFEVRIRISKRPGVDHYSGDMEATNTTALIEALAVLIQKAADIIGAPVDRVYSVVATVLFAERGMDDVDNQDDTGGLPRRSAPRNDTNTVED